MVLVVSEGATFHVFANNTVVSEAVGGKRMTSPPVGVVVGFGLEPSEPPGREGLGGRLAGAPWSEEGSRCLPNDSVEEGLVAAVHAAMA